MQKDWGFYGRKTEITAIKRVLDRGRWFFCALSGRRRIGKTALIREALQASGRPLLYVQIPDSDERGVVQAFQDAIENMAAPPEGDLVLKKIAGAVKSFHKMALLIEVLCRENCIIILDEFQYFHRKALSPFQSFLQASIDKLRDTDKGGLFVLGSIHTEMTAILEDRNAPLFNRITDKIEVKHLDFPTIFGIFAAHGVSDPAHQLFLWSLFKGVPKFYRDCFEEGVLTSHPNYRMETLRRLFFEENSSPLRDEADNWFLREFRGRYDTVLRLLARLGPCSHGTLMDEFRRAGVDSEKQLGGYLNTLIEKYGMVEKRQPIFSKPSGRKARYAITDNFLTSWLGALKSNVEAARIMPLEKPLRQANEKLAELEGFAFEKMVRGLTVECSRKGVGDFTLSQMVNGYWNSADIEIDLIAVSEDERIIRFGSCKRNAAKHFDDITNFDGHVARFLKTKESRPFADWRIERALYAPVFSAEQRASLTDKGYLCRDLLDFKNFLYP
jgi:AAA+ ATPase superfamily predicted ATPase